MYCAEMAFGIELVSGAFMYCAGMALSSFGNLHVLRWYGTELIWEPSCVALAWHRADWGSFMLHWRGTEL